ncbi:MAG TPA: alpha/beta fold hydrolase [Thermoleophilaceae bacterium]|nr:alpha/beta fold hydrolase [Thermoleophilaceae bacterium]
MRSAVTARPQLAFSRSGAGDPLVLIHPLGGDRHVWDPVLPDLSDDHDCIAVDMPGFGDSPPLPEDVPATAAAIAASVVDTLDALGVATAHVAGISLGGWVALELGKTGRARSVTAICTAGLWPRPLGPRRNAARDGARALLPLLPLIVRSRRLRTLAFRGTMTDPTQITAADALQRIRAYANGPGFDSANAEMRASVFTGFDQIPVPVTLAWGEHDRLVRPPSTPPAVTRTVLLTGCGHVPTWDDPAQVAALIRSSAADAASRATRD